MERMEGDQGVGAGRGPQGADPPPEETREPLALALALQVDAARVGFDWDGVSGPLAKLSEEIAEVEEAVAIGDATAIQEELGDLLFSVVNVARLAGADATTALDFANRKFLRRFSEVQRLALDRGIPLPGASLEELDVLWDEVKALEGGETP